MATPIPLDELQIFDNTNLPDEKTDFASGAVLLLNKPKGWTSFRVVGLLRKLIGVKKVGHAGTLDPMATGLLILCTGKATKSISLIQEQYKIYQAEITFGFSTPSYDAETEPDLQAPADHISTQQIKTTISEKFSGCIEQLPPMYSAVKHKGQRLYKLARKGMEVERKIRKVEIYRNTILEFAPPKLLLEIHCSKGTYIRSLAHDLGLALESRAHLSGLERTAIGEYHNERSLNISQIKNIFNCNDAIDLSA